MDALVAQALQKWPNVPACYGWLALDGRGRWRIGLERSLISNAAMNAFIARNYMADADGNWMFQNGPQRVFVNIECMPFVWQIVATPGCDQLIDQCGNQASPLEGAWLDDAGRFILVAGGRSGVVHDHDAALLIDRLRDANGAPLATSEASSRLEAHMAGNVTLPLFLDLAGSDPRQVRFVHQSALESQFGFIALPKP